MYIYIVEGPAGSGKSTIISERLANWPGAILLDARPEGHPRNYAGPEGLRQATAKDLSVMGQMVTTDAEMVLVDRWLLSSLVYDSLRGEAQIPDQRDFNYFMNGWLQMLVILQSSLGARGRAYADDIQINWMFNIPPTSVVQGRRLRAGKEYPFFAAHEVNAYREVSERMAEFIDNGPGIPEVLEMDMQDISNGEWEW